MSDRPTNKNLLAAAAVITVVAIAVFAMLRSTSTSYFGQPAGGAAALEETTAAGGEAGQPASGRRAEKPLGRDAATTDDEAVEYLREQFGDTIENKRAQIKAIEKLIGYLIKKYPEDWQDRLQALLAKAFPGLADQLFAQFQNMSSYNDWMKAHHGELAQMEPAERRAAMRDARTQFFGADADEIFAESLRQDQILDAKDAIEQSPDKTLADKLDTYRRAIDDAYGEEAPAFLERRQTELTNDFLRMPSVQQELHSMSAQDRARELESIRSGMGMDDDALTRWRDLDAERDRSWDAGERYMERREEITRSSQGDEQDRRLAALRNEMFGAEADIIRDEEASGFFRFGHRRVFGKE